MAEAFRSRKWIVLGLAVAVLLGSVGFAAANLLQQNGGGGIIRACVNNGSGEVRIIGPDQECQKNWTLLEWNVQGPPGPAGLNCWDLNGNGVPDPGEDTNGDGVVDVWDCRGAALPQPTPTPIP